ncbi:Fur family transcriptional regulator [Hippea maritima]|uniref:Ferric uptake regulator, Fur family n=1 Tax=Hippea maritima (strain ATCC 700847 / DSM 10411 / MH2) TaxID=760142 RepID=F2LU70_HIPMA|nr:transcriptional repressor [Hippea maritima]AEA34533.1 ferric uptake regulator, Fur family [Hippea maritima DSM 10411]
MNNIKDLLNNTDLKATPQRLAILEEIHKAGHIDLETIYKNISQRFPSVSLATVYKNIHTLRDRGVIKELSIKGAKPKYEIAAQKPHHHLICKVCGDVIDIEIDTTFLKEQLKKVEDFEVSNCDIYCYGICSKCKGKSNS